MTWQPGDRAGGFDDYAGTIAQTTGTDPQPHLERWSTGSRRDVDRGERVYLLRQGSDRPGIVASGIATTDPAEGPHWDPAKKVGWFSVIEWDRVVGPDDGIPLDVLETEVPDFYWHPRGGGPRFSASQAAVIDALWHGRRAFGEDGQRAGGLAAEATVDAIVLLRRLLGLALPGPAGGYQVRAVHPPTVTVAAGTPRTDRPVAISEVQHALDELRADGYDPSDGPGGWRAGFLVAVLWTLPGVQDRFPPLLMIGRPGDDVDQPDDRSVRYDGPLTRADAGIGRGEQKALREHLFPRGVTHRRCALCGKRYPVEFLRAAHIKRRSLCSDAERRDLAHVAMPACVFGCDALFEAGLLAVEETGTIVAPGGDDGPGSEEAAAGYAAAVAGHTCRAHTPASAGYFRWHHQNVYRA